MNFKYFFILIGLGTTLTYGADFEPDQIQVSASSIVPSELLRSEHHQIVDPVTVSGLSNNYSIKTSFGPFIATNDINLRIRLHEINAIAGLRAIDKTELVAQSATKVISRPIETVEQVLNEPVETLKGIPGGVSKWFKRTSRKVKDGYESVKEAAESAKDSDSSNSSEPKASDVGRKIVSAGVGYAKRFLGLDKAYRALARQFEVDPYTDNKVLREELKEISRYSAAGSFGAGQLSISLPDELDTLRDVSNLVWESDPLDLLIRNEESVRNMGGSDLLIKTFFDNKFLTPTQQTGIVLALEQLKSVEGRLILIEYAAEAEDKKDARFMVRTVEFFRYYDANIQKLERLIATDRLPLAVNRKGSAVLYAPVDSLRWIKIVAEASHDMTKVMHEITPANTGELWIQGGISKAAENNLMQVGWSIHANTILRPFSQSKN